MVYVDILTYKYVDNAANLPEDWPAQLSYVYDNKEPVEKDWIRLEEVDYLLYIQEEERIARYEAALLKYENSKTLKITDIIDDNFSHLPPDKIDFRRHLKNNVYLNKTITMLKNGRPDVCEYTYNGEIYAKVRFEFLTNHFNLVYNKKTLLGYLNKNGEILHEYLLTAEDTDLGSPYGLQKGVQERFQARSYIFDEIKSYVNAVILQVYMGKGLSYEEVLADGGNFWKDYSAEISSWCNIGGMAVISDKLLSDTKYSFLNLPSGVKSLTIREWILDRITY
jgi:hypothetical protein